MGIGSEGVVSLEEGRKFVGTELNPAYFRQAAKNLRDTESTGIASDMFASLGAA
jgi:hypothetical protein